MPGLVLSITELELWRNSLNGLGNRILLNH